MRSKTTMALALASLSLLPAVVTAHSYHERYIAANVPLLGVIYCDEEGLLEGDVAGSCAPPVDEPLHSVEVRDDLADATAGIAAPTYAFDVCQDANDDGICGDVDEPSMSACGTVAFANQSRVPFRPGVQILTFQYVGRVTLLTGEVCLAPLVSRGAHWYYYDH